MANTMIVDEHKNIARWAMEFALKNGCSASRVSVITSNTSSFEYRDTQLDKLHQSTENKLYIELFTEGKYGAFSTNRIEKVELERLINEGIVSVRFLAPDLCRQLPDAARYYKPDGKNLDLFDASFANLDAAAKIDLLRNTVNEVRGTDDRIISISAVYDDGCSAEYMIASNGFEAQTEDTAFSLTAEVALKTAGDARPESYWYDSAIYWNDLQKTGIARKALERALNKIGQKKIKSGRYNMVLDNTVSSRMLSPMFSAMYGSSLQQKNSFLLHKLGQSIASSKLTIADRPHLSRSFGARWFDGEGVATFDRTIIDKGVLTGYFIDTYNALKMEVEPTIASPSVIIAETGEHGFSDLLKVMHHGIWVTAFNGGNCNPTTGDFSFGIEGFLVENGEVSQPVGEMNITGNMLVFWSSLMEVGNDPRQNSSWKMPSVLFSDVAFSGL